MVTSLFVLFHTVPWLAFCDNSSSKKECFKDTFDLVQFSLESIVKSISYLTILL